MLTGSYLVFQYLPIFSLSTTLQFWWHHCYECAKASHPSNTLSLMVAYKVVLSYSLYHPLQLSNRRNSSCPYHCSCNSLIWIFLTFFQHKHSLIFIKTFPKAHFYQDFWESLSSSSVPSKKAVLETWHLSLNPGSPLSSWMTTKKPTLQNVIKMKCCVIISNNRNQADLQDRKANI